MQFVTPFYLLQVYHVDRLHMTTEAVSIDPDLNIVFVCCLSCRPFDAFVYLFVTLSQNLTLSTHSIIVFVAWLIFAMFCIKI